MDTPHPAGRPDKRPTLHLMVGLPCSGKTTAAKQLEAACFALRLTPDEWALPLFGDTTQDPDQPAHHDTVERLLWQVAARVLSLGVSVILDFGFWSRIERDDFRERARALGVLFQIHYLDVPENELYRRLEVRNKRAGADVFTISGADMAQYISLFEPPTADELCGPCMPTE